MARGDPERTLNVGGSMSLMKRNPVARLRLFRIRRVTRVDRPTNTFGSETVRCISSRSIARREMRNLAFSNRKIRMSESDAMVNAGLADIHETSAKTTIARRELAPRCVSNGSPRRLDCGYKMRD